MIGTVRNTSDQEIVDSLKEKASDLGILDRLEFEINQDRCQIVEIFKQAKVAIHTMEFEHFGIAVVELMSAGIITIAHNSAGPKQDIIGASKQPVGYLADTAENYAYCATQAIIEYDNEFHTAMRKNARKWVTDQFGAPAFMSKF
jgi:alpha-1,2-mannosyltransferase